MKQTKVSDVLKVKLEFGEEIVVFMKDSKDVSKGKVVAQKKIRGKWVYKNSIS